jgi:hypothetical protein
MAMLQYAQLILLYDTSFDDLIRAGFEKIWFVPIVMSGDGHQPLPLLTRHTWKKNFGS